MAAVLIFGLWKQSSSHNGCNVGRIFQAVEEARQKCPAVSASQWILLVLTLLFCYICFRMFNEWLLFIEYSVWNTIHLYITSCTLVGLFLLLLSASCKIPSILEIHVTKCGGRSTHITHLFKQNVFCVKVLVMLDSLFQSVNMILLSIAYFWIISLFSICEWQNNIWMF